MLAGSMRRLARPLYLGLALATAGACAGARATAPPPRNVASKASPPASAQPIASRAAPQSPAPPPPRPNHPPLIEPPLAPLAAELHEIPLARALLAVADAAGERVAWARRVDVADPSSHLGAPWRLEGEHVIGAFDAGDGATALATSDGRRVCIAHYPRDAAQPDRRGCAEASPILVAPLGGKLALIETEVSPTHHHRAQVEVRVRWSSMTGDIEGAASPTGLSFESPFEGMQLIAAAARPHAVDLLWYETAPKRPTKASLGSGALGAGTLRDDGAYDPASRAAVLASDLEHGSLRGRRAPRLVSNGESTVVVVRESRGGACTAVRVAPTLGREVTLGDAACAIDPAGPADASAGMARILAASPRRTPLQSSADRPLVVWAGDRAYFVGRDGALRSADRDTGTTRDEPAPFPAHRAPVAWSSIESDGSALAWLGDRLFAIADTAREVPLGALDARVVAAIRAPDPPDFDRSRAARIGDGWWVARGAVVRVSPTPLMARGLAGRAHPDTTALVGGEARGLFFELAGGQLAVTAVAEDGTTSVLSRAPSPVRVGFAAVRRRAGGAILAGADARDPGKVVALAVDASGALGAPLATSLVAEDGFVRVLALPAGGAVLADRARRRAVWLDDDAHEIAAAPWPPDESTPACPTGSAAHAIVPSLAPGKLTRVEELADLCTVGDPAWTPEGVTAIGTAMVDFDLVPSRSTSTSTPTPAPTSTSTSTPAPARACPAEMVSIRDRFCIDRFEDTLVDARTGGPLSPDFSAEPRFFSIALADWVLGRASWGDAHARAFPLPPLDVRQIDATPAPLAVSRAGARPNGYVRGLVAEAACAAAGKRLCTKEELAIACRGEDDTQFPYGATYVEGACNVHRDDHPAAILHANASIGHLDPRLDRVAAEDGPLMRATGATPSCKSRWGADAAYDLVGNLDEWVAAPKGAFAGGFYSRATKAGCEALITAHPKEYLDYSTGVRCCAAPR